MRLYYHKLLPGCFFLSEQVITEIECRHWHHFCRIIVSPLKWRMSGHSPKFETRPAFLSNHPLPTCSVYKTCTNLQNDFFTDRKLFIQNNRPIFTLNAISVVLVCVAEKKLRTCQNQKHFGSVLKIIFFFQFCSCVLKQKTPNVYNWL